jgi:hypothetical protein
MRRRGRKVSVVELRSVLIGEELWEETWRREFVVSEMRVLRTHGSRAESSEYISEMEASLGSVKVTLWPGILETKMVMGEVGTSVPSG